MSLPKGKPIKFDTIKQGKSLVKLFKLRLQQESFWRILYYKKYPNVSKIAHEYILITEKQSAVMAE